MQRVSFFVKEVATATGLSPQTVRRMIKTGKLWAIRAGKRILVPKEALEKFLRNGTDPRRL